MAQSPPLRRTELPRSACACSATSNPGQTIGTGASSPGVPQPYVRNASYEPGFIAGLFCIVIIWIRGPPYYRTAFSGEILKASSAKYCEVQARLPSGFDLTRRCGQPPPLPESSHSSVVQQLRLGVESGRWAVLRPRGRDRVRPKGPRPPASPDYRGRGCRCRPRPPGSPRCG